jgi:hypothetical protein
MAGKQDNAEYTLKLTGPGHSFERKVGEEIANKVISFVMSGSVNLESSGGNLGSGSAAQHAHQQASPGGNLTPKQFMSLKKPENNYERVACLAYYLTNNRQTPHYKTADINKLNVESAHSFSNAAAFVADAASKFHYLSPAGGGKKQITPLGEALVEALPDRAKVQAALAEHKPRKKGKKRKKSK